MTALQPRRIHFSRVMKPTIVFAPGAWHQPSCFDRIRQSLHRRGYSTDAVSYPSVGFEPNSTLSDDTTALRRVLEKVASTGKEIVLVLHSYGGMVGSNAVDGLGVHERMQQKKKGGVIMVVFMAAFAIPKGKMLRDVPTGASWIKFEASFLDYGSVNPNIGQASSCYPLTPEEVFYHDLPVDEQRKAISNLKPSATAILSGCVTYEPWNHIPCMFLFCDNDRAMTLEVQKAMAANLGENAVFFHCSGSHSAFMSVPEEVMEGIEIAAAIGMQRTQVA